MADTTATVPVQAAQAKGGRPLIPLIFAIVVTMAGLVGGAIYWLMRSGMLPVAGAASLPTIKEAKAPKTRLMELQPILVNLSDPGGAGYLRVVMVLRVEDAETVKPEAEKPLVKGQVAIDENESLLRDAAITVLARETSERVLAADGKEHTKEELKTAFAAQDKALKVDDVLFTEFLVQR
jgi:flagellar FliL protein